MSDKIRFVSADIACEGAEQCADIADGGLRLVLRPEAAATITKAAAIFAFDFEKDDKLFLNGYQSWTLSREKSIFEVDNSMRFCPAFLDKKFGFSAYGDGTFYKRAYKKGIHHGYSYAYIRRGDRYIFIGSLAENTGFTRIVFDVNRGEIIAEKDCIGREITEEYTVFDLYFAEGSESEVFDGWFSRLNVTPLLTEKMTGYTSWYNYYQNISESIIINDLNSMSKLSPKPDIFQIDDGYESKVGDWLTVNAAKFPSGMAPVAAAIRDGGFIPGIWLAPFVCERESALFKEHEDWLAKSNGEFVYGGCNWSGMYALDFYNSEVQDYIRACISSYKEMGFKLFKLDFLYAACMLPRKDKTRGEIMFEAMDFLRDCCGDAAILGCGVPMAAAFGKVEFCRIGMDMTLDWNDKPFMRLFHPERPSTRNTMLNTIYRRQLSGRAFINDPDVFLLRDYNIKLNDEQKRALASVNCLFGGLLFTSDNFDRYSEEQLALYKELCALSHATDISANQSGKIMTVTYRFGGKTHTLKYRL